MLVRWRLLARERRRRRFEESWRPRLLQAMLSSGVIRPTPHRFNREEAAMFLHLWLYFSQSVVGSAQNGLNALARSCGIVDLSRRWLRYGDLRERLLAISALGHLREVPAWHVLAEMAAKSSPAISLAAARSLVQIDAARAVPLLTPAIATRTDWSPAAVAGILREAGADMITGPLLAAAASAPAEHAARLIRYVGSTHSREALPALRQILHKTRSDEIVAGCLEVLGLLSDPADASRLRAFAHHPNWTVRVQAARGLGRLAEPEDRFTLVRLLCDPEWWVRYRAAQSLALLPGATVESLVSIRHILDDTYARDMLTQVMEEKGMDVCL
jgi:HEAT repeat protein